MKYFEVQFGDSISFTNLPWWRKLLKRVLPAANPDVEKLYEDVYLWWLEVNDDGEPNREIGFNEMKEPIVLGPIGENYGFLTDTGKVWNDWSEEKNEIQKEFEYTWIALWRDFEYLETKEANSQFCMRRLLQVKLRL